jgi:hypothetical protein
MRSRYLLKKFGWAAQTKNITDMPTFLFISLVVARSFTSLEKGTLDVCMSVIKDASVERVGTCWNLLESPRAMDGRRHRLHVMLVWSSSSSACNVG